MTNKYQELKLYYSKLLREFDVLATKKHKLEKENKKLKRELQILKRKQKDAINR